MDFHNILVMASEQQGLNAVPVSRGVARGGEAFGTLGRRSGARPGRGRRKRRSPSRGSAGPHPGPEWDAGSRCVPAGRYRRAWDAAIPSAEPPSPAMLAFKSRRSAFVRSGAAGLPRLAPGEPDGACADGRPSPPARSFA